MALLKGFLTNRVILKSPLDLKEARRLKAPPGRTESLKKPTLSEELRLSLTTKRPLLLPNEPKSVAALKELFLVLMKL
jgi:hypothetical protein